MSRVDIGVNFHSSQLKDVGAGLLARVAAGVTHVLATGTSLHSSAQALEFAHEHARVWATAGVHPHAAKDWTPAVAAEFEPLLEAKTVAAGFDFYLPKPVKLDRLLSILRTIAPLPKELAEVN
jgi:TatD DNase family protein